MSDKYRKSTDPKVILLNKSAEHEAITTSEGFEQARADVEKGSLATARLRDTVHAMVTHGNAKLAREMFAMAGVEYPAKGETKILTACRVVSGLTFPLPEPLADDASDEAQQDYNQACDALTEARERLTATVRQSFYRRYVEPKAGGKTNQTEGETDGENGESDGDASEQESEHPTITVENTPDTLAVNGDFSEFSVSDWAQVIAFIAQTDEWDEADTAAFISEFTEAMADASAEEAETETVDA